MLLINYEIISRQKPPRPRQRRKSIISNVQREDIGAIEMPEALQTLLDEDKSIHTQRQLAGLIGKSEGWVSEMLRILTLSAKHQEQLWTSQVSVSCDSAMRIARCEPALQADLIAATLRGETTREIRSRIAESKDPAKGKQGSESSKVPAKLMRTFSGTCKDCTATVRGPEGDKTRRNMRAAVEKLLQLLQYNPADFHKITKFKASPNFKPHF